MTSPLQSVYPPRGSPGPAGDRQDPWKLVAELRGLASLTANIAAGLASSLSLKEGLESCADALVRGLDAAFARIWTLNDTENVLELQASAGLYTHLDGPHGRVPVGQLKIGLIAQERKPHFTNAVIGDPRISDQEWARREGMIAFAGYPLLGDNGRLLGVLALFGRHAFSGATQHALATVADSIAQGITHWRAIEALRASEERFVLAIRGTHEGIWDWNVLTNEAYLSARFKALLGYEEHEVESSYAMWEARLHPEDRERVLWAVQDHLKLRQPFQVDYRLRTKSGDYRWFQARGQALWSDAGQPVRMLGAISDVTDRKLAERRLAALHQVTRILAETADSKDALPRILRSLCEELSWSVGEYWVRDPHVDLLLMAAVHQQPFVAVPTFVEASQGLSIKRGVGLAGVAWSSEKPVWLEDIATEPHVLRSAEAAVDNLHAAVAFPILIGGQVHGVMEFFKNDAQKPDEDMLLSLADIGQQISRCFELQQEQQKVRQHHHEMAIARAIQQHMFPRVMPVPQGFLVAGASRTANDTGGDYCDFMNLPNDDLLIALGDVSGHGLGPAILMATARAYLRILALTEFQLDTIVNRVNTRLVEDMDFEFMTLFLGQVDPSSRQLTYINAGHCPGVILDAQGLVRHTLSSTDAPLGIDRRRTYQQSQPVQLLPSDLLLLVSDGVYEARDPNGNQLGMQWVIETVRASRGLAPAAIITALFDAVRRCAPGGQRDDMTCIVVKLDEATCC